MSAELKNAKQKLEELDDVLKVHFFKVNLILQGKR